jgi:hypothetical protein
MKKNQLLQVKIFESNKQMDLYRDSMTQWTLETKKAKEEYTQSMETMASLQREYKKLEAEYDVFSISSFNHLARKCLAKLTL